MRRQQGSDEGLANFVDVALGRAEDYYTGHRTLRPQFLEFGIEDRHGGTHGFGGGHHVGEIHLSAGELLPDIVHAGYVAVIDRVDGSDSGGQGLLSQAGSGVGRAVNDALAHGGKVVVWHRSEEHTSELQSLRHLVCRLLLEKKNET